MDSTSTKPTLGIFSLNSCNGCQEQVLNADTILPELADQVEIVYWKKIMEADFPEHLDIAVIEGAIETSKDNELATKIRGISEKVIALGLCACGLNWKDDERTFKPLNSCIDVDLVVRCCPIDTTDFINAVQKAIYGRNTFISTATLCGTCKMNEVECILDYGRLCGGLITQTGCGAICTNLGETCYGCGGISVNSQIETAKYVFANTNESETLDEFLEACNVDRLLQQNIDNLDIDKAAFVVSRKCGKHSHRNVIEFLKNYELENSLAVNLDVQNLRDAILEISNARNYLSDLFFNSLRKAYSYNSFFDFYKEQTDTVSEFLETRLILNTALTELTGRAIHPITLKAGGVSTQVSEEALRDIREDLETIVDFAISTVDLSNKLWEKTEVADETPVLNEVMQIWNEMCDDARFAAAKAGLREPETDSRRECVAKAVYVVNCIRTAIEKLG